MIAKTYVVQDVDDHKDTHPRVQFAEESTLEFPTSFVTTELCVGIRLVRRLHAYLWILLLRLAERRL